MTSSKEIIQIAEELGREKGIARELIADALKEAMLAAAVKKMGSIGKFLEPEAEVDLDRGIVNILIPTEVTETGINNIHEVSLETAAQYKENPALGDIVMVPTTLKALGRIAAQVAKQKLLEKLKEAEKQVILDEFENKIGEIVNGIILKTDRDNVIVGIGKTEAVLSKREMIPGDFFSHNEYIRALLLDIKIVKGWPQLVLSRTHPAFLKKLFEAEIPEVFEGLIEVKGASREPGDRAKVSVYSTNPNIDPVGACIGIKGSRINAISKELGKEKIDVIEWSPNPVTYVCNAISPAKVLLTNIIEDDKTIEVVVADDELSLAIGKRGQNVRLAAILTEWRLDVLKESEYAEIRQSRLEDQEQVLKEYYELNNLENLSNLNNIMVSKLIEIGIDDIEKLSSASIDEIVSVLDVSDEDAVNIINSAIDYLTAKLDELDESNQEVTEEVDSEEIETEEKNESSEKEDTSDEDEDEGENFNK